MSTESLSNSQGPSSPEAFLQPKEYKSISKLMKDVGNATITGIEAKDVTDSIKYEKKVNPNRRYYQVAIKYVNKNNEAKSVSLIAVRDHIVTKGKQVDPQKALKEFEKDVTVHEKWAKNSPDARTLEQSLRSLVGQKERSVKKFIGNAFAGNTAKKVEQLHNQIASLDEDNQGAGAIQKKIASSSALSIEQRIELMTELEEKTQANILTSELPFISNEADCDKIKKSIEENKILSPKSKTEFLELVSDKKAQLALDAEIDSVLYPGNNKKVNLQEVANFREQLKNREGITDSVRTTGLNKINSFLQSDLKNALKSNTSINELAAFIRSVSNEESGKVLLSEYMTLGGNNPAIKEFLEKMANGNSREEAVSEAFKGDPKLFEIQLTCANAPLGEAFSTLNNSLRDMKEYVQVLERYSALPNESKTSPEMNKLCASSENLTNLKTAINTLEKKILEVRTGKDSLEAPTASVQALVTGEEVKAFVGAVSEFILLGAAETDRAQRFFTSDIPSNFPSQAATRVLMPLKELVAKLADSEFKTDLSRQIGELDALVKTSMKDHLPAAPIPGSA